MKKATLFFTSLITLLFISCTGPEGPPGPQGPQGLDAPQTKVIDIKGSFSAESDYSFRHTFDKNAIEVLPTDIVLVYLLWEQVDGSDGLPIDVWRLLPQTRILDQGLLQYNYQSTFVDVDIFLDADFDLATLPVGDTDNQIFRIAVIPASKTNESKLDKSNMAAVLQTLGVAENEIPRLN